MKQSEGAAEGKGRGKRERYVLRVQTEVRTKGLIILVLCNGFVLRVRTTKQGSRDEHCSTAFIFILL